MNKLIILLFAFLFASPVLAENDQTAAKIIVYKTSHVMELIDKNDHLLKRYKIALGAQPKGHKTQEGDEKTPEGLYQISGRNPNSRYHLSLRISYPNRLDVSQAEKRGVSPGGDIMIHGLPNGTGWLGAKHLLHDTWTDGCIAVTNEEIEEIWNMVPDKTPIEILP